MTTSLRLLARRSVPLLVSKTARPALCHAFLRGLSASSKLPLPPEDYDDEGHLLTNQLEYIDDMLDKTLEIEESMAGLKETYAKKKEAYSNVGWMEAAEIDRLFETAASQKEQLSAQISELKSIMQSAKRTFAVDGPDGTPDARSSEEMEQVNHIIDEAAAHENASKVKQQHKAEKAIHKERARDPEHDW